MNVTTRTGAFLLIFLFALATVYPNGVLAQGEPVPDTLDWRRYFPLEIGNQWHYRTEYYGEVDYERWQVRGDTLLNGKHYFQLHISDFGADRQFEQAYTTFIRYDATHANVVAYGTFSDGTPSEDWFGGAPCALDAPFGARTECTGIRTGMDYWVYGDYDARYLIGADTVRAAVRKSFSSLGGDMVLLSDIGRVSYAVELGPVVELIYAEVGGTRYGDAVLPTPTETPLPEAEVFGIETVYPNPFRATATLRYTLLLPSLVCIEVYNLLGRRVLAAEEHRPHGTHEFLLDGAGLPAGTYLVRLVTAEGRRDVQSITLIN